MTEHTKTTDSEVLSAMKELLEKQTLSVHQTLQQYMSTVDSRLEEFQAQIRGSVGVLSGHSRPSEPMTVFTEGFAGGTDFSPLLQFRINEFFDLHGTLDNLRLRIASFHMEGRAAAWYQWMKANNLLTTWRSFLVSLKSRFGASMYEDHQGNLSKLTQTSTVADFQSAFEDLMNKVTGISEPLLISFFITGLKSDIRREFLFTRPTSLMEAFALARAYEARSDEVKTTSRSWSKWPPTTPPASPNVPPVLPNTSTFKNTNPLVAPVITTTKPPSQPPLLPTPNLPICRLTPAELRDKREKGLCYNCDKKYSANHRCRSKFLLLMGTDDEERDPGEEGNIIEHTEEVVTADISSLNALAGQSNPRSLRVLGEIKGH
ncbi:hypothetical protein KPL71_025874 [Citrus sinensis]|uniref:Uncharacterized protein n=1 Tax=Citrus sinensis TaxID=2711 RepID=A0ACB8HVL8_CITSI|nr:hypothetical protein KPL71_025874 [Citrus sinensis]